MAFRQAGSNAGLARIPVLLVAPGLSQTRAREFGSPFGSADFVSAGSHHYARQGACAPAKASTQKPTSYRAVFRGGNAGSIDAEHGIPDKETLQVVSGAPLGALGCRRRLQPYGLPLPGRLLPADCPGSGAR